MAVIQRYVNRSAANSPGGDGTTNGVSGSTRAYYSSSEAEANEAASFNGDRLVVTCTYGTSGSDDTTFLYIDGSTMTTAADYITWEPASGDEAVKGGIESTRYTIAPSTSDVAVTMGDQYIRINGLQVINATTGIRDRFTPANSELYVDSCYVDCNSADQGIEIGDADTTAYIRNNVIIGPQANFRGGLVATAGTIYAYDNIFYGLYDGIRNLGGTTTAVNCASFNNSNNDFNSVTTVDHCISDDGTGTNAQTIVGDEFTNPATGNFTAVASTAIDGNGIGPTSDANVPTLDIEGDTRSGTTCTIGVDEIVAGGTTYNEAIAESIGLSETQVAALIMDPAIAESIGLSETQVALLDMNIANAESIALSETQASTLIMSSAIAESIGVTDSQSALIDMIIAIAESVGLTDSQSLSGSIYDVVVSESIGLSDTQAGVFTLVIGVSESIGLSDLQSTIATFAAAIAESIGLSDVTTIGDLATGKLCVTISGAGPTITIVGTTTEITITGTIPGIDITGEGC